MELKDKINIVRLMTGSTLSADKIIFSVNAINKSTKRKVCPKVEEMVKKYNETPFDKAFSLVENEFNELAKENKIDPAVLFCIYMDWKNKRQK